jgi:hypothetical protein
MAILSGELYVELARSIEQELSGQAPHIVRHLNFDRPIVLSGEPIVVRAAVREAYFGPEECNSDNMLREPFAKRFAALYREQADGTSAA